MLTFPRAFVAATFAALSLAARAQPADLDAMLQQALEGSRTPAVGVVEIVQGQVARSAVRGLRRSDGAEPVTLDDRWLIGSDAKPMTTALLARLVDRGLLRWDQPLAELLPSLKASMRPAYRSVTLMELLSHRAGLPENTSDMKFFNGFYKDKRDLPAQRLAYVGRALREAPIAPPRTKTSYSNTGFILAAVIAERAAGRPYEQLMRDEVFGPLGMTSVDYGPPPAGQPQGHTQGKPVQRAEQSNPLMFAPAGNLHLSLADWARFCVDQLAGARGEGKLLTAASYQRMHAAAPAFALGWGVQASVAGRKGPVWVHAGSDGNWYAIASLFPDTGHGTLVVANAGPDMDGDKVAQAVWLGLLPKP
ncbi:MAG TPA: serine hydrolase domain-containing protein [Roseateles sp.]